MDLFIVFLEALFPVPFSISFLMSRLTNLNSKVGIVAVFQISMSSSAISSATLLIEDFETCCLNLQDKNKYVFY